MKVKVVIFILVLAALALGVGLKVQHSRATQERETHLDQIRQLSNVVMQTRAKLDEQQSVNLTLETNLLTRKVEFDTLSNRLVTVASTLTKTESEAKAAAEAASQSLSQRDAKIAELEGERTDLTKRMGDLTNSMAGLEKQIFATEKKLAASEGDRNFLLKELKRLQSEKAELERQFNDLALLREQYRKLKEELSIARRLEWLRQGLYGRQNQKGAERLNNGLQQAPLVAMTNGTLDVELKQGGSAKIVSPGPAVVTPGTNGPAVK